MSDLLILTYYLGEWLLGLGLFMSVLLIGAGGLYLVFLMLQAARSAISGIFAAARVTAPNGVAPESAANVNAREN
jgi:hypothetical protein